MSERSQSDQGHWQDQGHAGQADGIGWTMEHDRIRWRCRRGLLELDLVLSRFIESRFDHLTSAQRGALTRLLSKNIFTWFFIVILNVNVVLDQ